MRPPSAKSPAMISRPPPPLWAHHHGGVLWQVRAAAGRSQMFEASAGRAAPGFEQHGVEALAVFNVAACLRKHVQLVWLTRTALPPWGADPHEAAPRTGDRLRPKAHLLSARLPGRFGHSDPSFGARRSDSGNTGTPPTEQHGPLCCALAAGSGKSKITRGKPCQWKRVPASHTELYYQFTIFYNFSIISE